MDISARLVSIVRRIVGLPDDPGAPPRIDRLAFYRCEVKACASDGSTVDVTPANKLIAPLQKVPLLTGVPNGVAVVKAGSIVRLGWDGGDPSQPYAIPLWESATVSKFTLTVGGQVIVVDDNGTKVTITTTTFNVKAGTSNIGDTSGTSPAGLGDRIDTRFSNLETAFANHTHPVPGTGTTCVNGSPWTGTATSQVTTTTISSPPNVKSGSVNVKQ